jgi:ABC-2 type transport system ATP-binding protein
VNPDVRVPAAVPGSSPIEVSGENFGDCCYCIQGLTKSYRVGRGRNAVRVPANDGIDLTIRRGEIFGVLGPNGAGKSTLIRQLTGLIRPDAGRILLFGHDVIARPGMPAVLVAYLAQECPALDELTVGLAIETTGRLRGLSVRAARAERDSVISELGLTSVRDRAIRRLSGGQRRLACVATALVGQRPVLVLDEPTTGVDPHARRAVWAAIDRRRLERGTTVVLVTHNVLEAESVLDRVAVLDAGRIIACDTPNGLKANVDDQVRLELVWRTDPPLDDPTVAMLRARSTGTGPRWSLWLTGDDARTVLARLTSGPAFAALDDFTVTTPSLEDVYLALGGRYDGLVRG